MEAEDSNRPLIVGERTNVIGSRLFKNMVAEEKWEEASEIARWQVKNGAHIIDVCLQSSAIATRSKDIAPFYEKLMPKIKAPMMIDTTDPKAVELALTYCQGKIIINSINLEDGEEKFERVCPLARKPTARRWWWAPSTKTSCRRRRSRASANWPWRSVRVKLLTEKYGIAPEDIIFDPLVFPCATGDENYIGGAVETIEAIRLIKENMPYRQDDSRHFQYLLRPAGGGARSGQFGLPLLLRPRRASIWPSSTRRSWSASRRSRWKSGAWRRTCCSTRRRDVRGTSNRCERRPKTGASRSREQKIADQSVPHRGHRRAFPQDRQEGQEESRRPAARRAPGELHHRRHQGRPDSPIWIASAPKAPRRSTSSTVR